MGGWECTFNLATVLKSRKRGFLCFPTNLPALDFPLLPSQQSISSHTCKVKPLSHSQMCKTHTAHQIDSCECRSIWHMQSRICCRCLLFFIPLSLALRLSSLLNTAVRLTGPLRTLVVGWIKWWHKKRLKGHRKQWLLKEGESSNSQSRGDERVPEPHSVRREWVNPLVTLGSGSGHYRIKEDMIHAYKDHRFIPQHQQLELTSN